jgi:hypothetical protein
MTPEPGLSARALKEQAGDLVRGLDARERAVLLAINEHKVLVTEHLKAMFFGSVVAPRIACVIWSSSASYRPGTRPSQEGWARHQDITR